MGASVAVLWLIFWSYFAVYTGSNGGFGFGVFMAIGFPMFAVGALMVLTAILI